MWRSEHTRARTSSHVLQRDSVLGCGVASACQADRLSLTAWSEGCRRGEEGTDFRTLQTTKTNSLPGREPPSEAVSHWQRSESCSGGSACQDVTRTTPHMKHGEDGCLTCQRTSRFKVAACEVFDMAFLRSLAHFDSFVK